MMIGPCSIASAPRRAPSALRRLVHAGNRAVQLPGARLVQRRRHRARRAGALCLHLRRLGVADRADGARRGALAMLQGPIIILTAFAYLGVLFAIAYYADQRADAGRPVIANAYVYSLSLAVYATAWTFYGSVGRAASDGIGFLPIYIGPTLMIALWWVVMRKILRISKQDRITSPADFIPSRHGKSALLGGIVTVIAVVGILPYISPHLKPLSPTFPLLFQLPP